MRDGTHSLNVVSAIAPATYTDDNTPITIDRSGYDSLTFALMIGAGGIAFTATNRIDFVMEHSDDGAVWDPVGADNVLRAPIGTVDGTNGIVRSQRTAHPAPTVDRIGYVDGTIGDRRYVRLRPDFNGTHGTGTPISAVAILGEPRNTSAF